MNDKIKKLEEAYANLNEALSNKRVNKSLVTDVIDSLEGEYKVKTFMFSDELSDIGLEQALKLNNYALDRLKSLNYENSKEVFDKTKGKVTGFIKYFMEVKKEYEVNNDVYEHMTNYYNNKAVSEYFVGDDDIITKLNSEGKKALLEFYSSDIQSIQEAINKGDRTNLINKLEDIVEDYQQTKYFPFLVFINGIVDVSPDDERYMRYYTVNQVIGKPIYPIDIIGYIVNESFLQALEKVLSFTLDKFYNFYCSDDTLKDLHHLEQLDDEEFKSLTSVTSILNVFQDNDGIEIFKFFVELIYSKKIK